MEGQTWIFSGLEHATGIHFSGNFINELSCNLDLCIAQTSIAFIRSAGFGKAQENLDSSVFPILGRFRMEFPGGAAISAGHSCDSVLAALGAAKVFVGFVKQGTWCVQPWWSTVLHVWGSL